MQVVKHVVISAAGMGSRLGLDMPKCLVEIDGRKLIDYQLDLLEDVKDVRIVVGFMEEMVIEHVRKIRNDVVFVRNPDYQKTTNSYSLYLATKDLKEPFLAIDGDLLIDPESFKNFLDKCKDNDSLVGITKSKTEEAVFVDLDKSKNVVGFKTSPRTKYEWSGMAYFHNIPTTPHVGYVFRILENYLPLKSVEILCHEIDTPRDLMGAYRFLRTYNKKAKNGKRK